MERGCSAMPPVRTAVWSCIQPGRMALENRLQPCPSLIVVVLIALCLRLPETNAPTGEQKPKYQLLIRRAASLAEAGCPYCPTKKGLNMTPQILTAEATKVVDAWRSDINAAGSPAGEVLPASVAYDAQSAICTAGATRPTTFVVEDLGAY